MEGSDQFIKEFLSHFKKGKIQFIIVYSSAIAMLYEFRCIVALNSLGLWFGFGFACKLPDT